MHNFIIFILRNPQYQHSFQSHTCWTSNAYIVRTSLNHFVSDSSIIFVLYWKSVHAYGPWRKTLESFNVKLQDRINVGVLIFELHDCYKFQIATVCIRSRRNRGWSLYILIGLYLSIFNYSSDRPRKAFLIHRYWLEPSWWSLMWLDIKQRHITLFLNILVYTLCAFRHSND